MVRYTGSLSAYLWLAALVIHPEGEPSDKQDLKKEWERLVAGRPKVECQIHRITAYRKAVVMRLTLENKTAKALRVNLETAPLWFRGLHFTDKEGRRWYVPRLTNHYYFGPITEKNSVVIGSGGAVELVLVDALEWPVLTHTEKGVPARMQGKRLVARYQFRWGGSFPQEDLSKPYVSVQFLGNGACELEIRRDDLAPGERSRAVPRKRPKDGPGSRKNQQRTACD
jgi:hypothetical protein